MVKTNDIYEVNIIKYDNDGKGITYLDDKIVFVDKALKDEIVKIRIDKINYHTIFATAIEIIKPSPNRIELDCKIANLCGGCQLRYMTYDEEAKIKQAKVEDVINKILGYNNTKGIELFNDAHAGSLVNPVAKVVEYRKNVPAPANSSDWFVPSAKELSLMTTGEVSDVWWDDYNTEICDLIRMQFAKLGENYAQDFSNFGWSSSEYLLDLPISPDLRSSRAYGVWFVDGAIDYDGKANDRVEARFILAF